MPLTTISIGMVTCCSTSSAARPGHCVTISHVVVGDVRIRFHGQIVKRDYAPDHQQDGRGQNQETVVQGEIDDLRES